QPAEEPVAQTPVAEEPAPEPAPAPASDNYKTDNADWVTGLDSPNGYNISINFVGDGWTDSLKQAFIDGAETVSDYVVGDVPDEDGVDDLHITATIENLGGAGGVFARGGATAVRVESGLTTEGVVRLDEADLGTMETHGVVGDFAFHEIMHAMGFGTTWGGGGVVENIDGSLRFTGENAIQAYNDEFASIAQTDDLSAQGVPLDSDGDHWDHGVFPEEILSPRLNASENVISSLTVAALEDMGYDTTYGDDPAAGEFEEDLIPLV
ncbi:hypothetical protein, partial [Roseobacter sp.]|uniref:hypothetical protein n=1 Tax=Roseobacter sp. TaxID=1907202 RepID=UPI0025E27150